MKGPAGAMLGGLVVLVWAALSAGPAGEVSQQPACGPAALFLLARSEGRPIELATIVRTLGEGTALGHSMSELAEASGRLGFPLQAVRITPGPWPVEGAAIVHLRRGVGGHFVVVRPLGGGRGLVQIIDPSGPCSVARLDDLTRSAEWTGLGLAPASPPRSWGGIGWVAGFAASGAAFLIWRSSR